VRCIPQLRLAGRRAGSEDCEALCAAGIDVWFDKSELRGGHAWDRRIRAQIRDCRLLVPVISADTEHCLNNPQVTILDTD
jgi:hypothetical protein